MCPVLRSPSDMTVYPNLSESTVGNSAPLLVGTRRDFAPKQLACRCPDCRDGNTRGSRLTLWRDDAASFVSQVRMGSIAHKRSRIEGRFIQREAENEVQGKI